MRRFCVAKLRSLNIGTQLVTLTLQILDLSRQFPVHRTERTLDR